MNKRKLLTLAMTLCMVAILAIGGTLAYFTDYDYQENCFTVGDVHIDLWEDFGDNDGVEELIPVVGDKNKIEKEIYVDNTGSKEAYVRIHFAIPAVLDSGDEDNPKLAAFDNILHWNMSRASMEEGKWNWNKDVDGDNYPGNGGNWNVYDMTALDGVEYNVYVATYESPLAVGATTVDAIHTVYLDADATNETIEECAKVLNGTGKWMIKVAAEACQVEGFQNAYDALNTAFGEPGTYTMNWQNRSADHGKFLVNND